MKQKYSFRSSFFDFDACSRLLREYGDAKALLKGQELHSTLVRIGKDRDKVLSSLLIRLYGKCGRLEDAKLVFDSVPHRNICTWNVLISAYAQNGHLRFARELFERSPELNAVSWNTIAHAYSHDGNFLEAKRLFDEMPERTVVGWNSLLSVYAQNGHFAEAVHLFKEMPVRDELSWNFIMSAHAMNEELDEARKLFERMPQRTVVSWNCMITREDDAKRMFDVMPERSVVSWNALLAGYDRQRGLLLFNKMPHFDIVSLNSMLAIYANIGNARESMVSSYSRSWQLGDARLYFEKMIERDVVSWTTMIAAYAGYGHVKEARSMFERLPQRDSIAWTSIVAANAQAGHMNEAIRCFKQAPVHDAMSWNAMISGFSISGRLEDARNMFNAMRRKDVVSWNSLLAGNDQTGLVKDAFDKMPAYNIVSWNSMIAAYAQEGKSEEALEVFKKMDIEGVIFDNASFTSMLSACTAVSSLDQGKLVYASIHEERLLANVVIGTAVISMFGKCGNLENAKSVFEKMPAKNIMTWNTIVTVYAQKAHLNEVLELLLLMVLEGVSPDDITMLCVLSTCSHAGLALHSHYYFISMISDFGIQVSPDHYRCMIDVLSRMGWLEHAESIISGMPFEPEGAAWNSLVNACRIHGDVERADRAANTLVGLKPEESTAYIQLASTYLA